MTDRAERTQGTNQAPYILENVEIIKSQIMGPQSHPGGPDRAHSRYQLGIQTQTEESIIGRCPLKVPTNDPTDPNTKATTYMAIALERNVTALGKT